MKIAIIGTGKVARNSYLPCLASLDDIELVYTNRTVSRAEACADEFGGTAYATIPELMASRPDVVMILTGEMDRYRAAGEVLEAGPKRIFFEKPLVAMHDQAHVTEEDFALGHEIMLRAAETGVETAMIFNYRFFDQTVRAKRIVNERGFGELTSVTALVHFACWSHCIDLIHYFGGPVTTISALAGANSHPYFDQGEAQDLTASFVTSGGAAGTIIGTSGIDFGVPLFELTLGFAGGRIHLRGLDGPMEVIDYAGDHRETFVCSRDSSRWDHYARSFEHSIEAYLASVRRGSPPPVPGIAGLEELRFEAALKRSIRIGAPVVVNEAFPIRIAPAGDNARGDLR